MGQKSTGIVFDNGDKDPRKKHPTMIPIAKDEIYDDVYYLVISSQVQKYPLYEERYYLVDEEMVESAHLNVPSMINLGEIHKGREFERTVGGLPPYIYKDVIRKFKTYQEKHPHELYEEIKSAIF